LGCSIAKTASKQALLLSVFPELSGAQQDIVVKRTADFCATKGLSRISMTWVSGRDKEDSGKRMNDHSAAERAVNLVLSPPARLEIRSQANWRSLLESAALEVLEAIAGIRLAPSAGSLAEPNGDCTALVGMGGALYGMTIVSCSRQVAARLALLMLGVFKPSSSIVCDGLGEICNMVAESFRSKVFGLAENCNLSPPTVITGKNYLLHTLDSTECFHVELELEGAPLWVSLVVAP
jgi:chemotaxis protein CheX